MFTKFRDIWRCLYQTASPLSKNQGSSTTGSASTILPLQLWHFLTRWTDRPFHMTENVIIVGAKFLNAEWFNIFNWPLIHGSRLDKIGAWVVFTKGLKSRVLSRLCSWLGSRLKAHSLTSLDTIDSCPSLGVSHGAGQLDGDLHRDSPLNIAINLVFVLQIQEITVTETKSMCWQTCPIKQIYLQPALCARIYCAVNKVCHACCHSRELSFWRTHEQRCFYREIEMTSQLLPLTLSERTSSRQSNDAIWDLRHDLSRDLTESRWFSFVNTTWLGPGPSLKWDSVRVQAKS